MDAPDLNCIQFFRLISIIRRGFLPGALCRSPNTISGVRSKKPAHPAFAMLQADELLFHLSSAVRADLIALSHRLKYPDCFHSAGNHRRS